MGTSNLINQVPQPSGSSACAIVVLFNPGPHFQRSLQSLQDQFKFIILIDNTPGEGSPRRFPENIEIVYNNRNLGIAAALNQGVLLALKKGCTWVATFDQDSELLPGYLNKVVAVARERSPNPVIVGCNYFDGSSGQQQYSFRRGSAGVHPRVVLITSGCFMPAQFVHDIGGFREDYFIDSVDHEFCLRANSFGAAILITVEPFMRHIIGEGSSNMGRAFSFQHPPVRRYYIARNTLATMRSYGLMHPMWAARQILRLAAEGFAIIAFESRKFEKLSLFLLGLSHGVIGRSGPFEAP